MGVVGRGLRVGTPPASPLSSCSAIKLAPQSQDCGAGVPAGVWETVQLPGSWQRGVSAGGSRNFASYPSNPCFPLLLPGPAPRCVRISLRQHCGGGPCHPIGFHVFQASPGTRRSDSEAQWGQGGGHGVGGLWVQVQGWVPLWDPEQSRSQPPRPERGGTLCPQVPEDTKDPGRAPPPLQEPVLSCVPHCPAPEVSRLCHLAAGTYRVIPSTYLPDTEGSFTLLIATRTDRCPPPRCPAQFPSSGCSP